jgi:CRP-like cAMP-binding protein
VTAMESLTDAELFEELPPDECRALSSVGRVRAFAAGETIFRRGDDASELYFVRRGRVELTFPLQVLGETRDTRFQSLEPGRALAWSALVPPYRLTMGARATTDVQLLAFSRDALLRHFAQRPVTGFAVMSRLARVIATRLHEMAALWEREVQRDVAKTYR